jgi:hypothetical protein
MRHWYQHFECFPPYPNIHKEPWYNKPSTNYLRNIIINSKRGITYYPRLITPQTAKDWLRK